MKFLIISMFFLSALSFSATQKQIDAWQKFSTRTAIKEGTKGGLLASKCEESRNKALESGCINQTIMDFIAYPPIVSAPVCSVVGDIILQFNKCGATDAQLKQQRIYSSEEIIRSRLNNSTYCNQDGVMPSAMCDTNRKNGLETNCITQWQYDIAARNNWAPVCIANADNELVLMGFCKCGCFSEDTFIMTGDPADFLEMNIVDLGNSEAKVIHLSEESSVDNPELALSVFEQFIKGKQVYKKVVTIKTEGKNPLTVTHDHAVLLDNGDVVTAENLKTSDRLFSSSGDSLPILSLEVREVQL